MKEMQRNINRFFFICISVGAVLLFVSWGIWSYLQSYPLVWDINKTFVLLVVILLFASSYALTDHPFGVWSLLVIIIIFFSMVCTSSFVIKDDYIVYDSNVKQVQTTGLLFYPYKKVGSIATIQQPKKESRKIKVLSKDMEEMGIALHIVSYFDMGMKEIKRTIIEETNGQKITFITDMDTLEKVSQSVTNEVKKRIALQNKKDWTVAKIQKELETISKQFSTSDIHVSVTFDFDEKE